MSVTPIEEMNYKELRSEVQRLRDEVSKMKRFYEDLFYNLDTVNFSPRLVRENKNLRTVVELTAEGLKTKVSASDVNKQIDSKYSQFEQTAAGIRTEVSAKVESVNGEVDSLRTEVEQTSESIKSMVSENDFYSFFEQTADGFTFDGEKTFQYGAGMTVSETKLWFFTQLQPTIPENPIQFLSLSGPEKIPPAIILIPTCSSVKHPLETKSLQEDGYGKITLRYLGR